MRFDKVVWVILLLAVIAFISYSNTLNNFFLDDDYILLVTRFFTNTGSVIHHLALRPNEFKVNIFPYFIWVCTAKVFGPTSLPHHLIMVILHITTACLFFLYAKKLNGSFKVAFYASAFFIASYASTETVARIMYLQYIMVTTCALMCLILSLSEDKFKRFMSFIFFLLALMSKEVASVIPCIILASELIFRGRQYVLKKWKFYLPFFAVVIAFLSLKFAYPDQFGSTGFLIDGRMPYIAFFREHGIAGGLILYSYKLITIPVYHILFSVNKFVFGEAAPHLKVLLALLTSLPIIAYILIGWRRFFLDKIIYFALMWVFFGALPFFFLLDSIDYNRGGLINTRYLYFASLGLWLVLARSLAWLSERRGKWLARTARIYAVIIISVFMAVLYGNNRAYQYASGVAKRISLETKNKFPLFKGQDTKLYFLNLKDELYFAKGVHLFKNGGLDGALLLTYGFLPKAYVVDRREYDERVQKYHRVNDTLLPEINLKDALAEGHVLKWDEALQTVVDGSGL